MPEEPTRPTRPSLAGLAVLGKPVATIAVTAFPDGRRRALAPGFDALLEKPVEPIELAREIARCAPRKRN